MRTAQRWQVRALLVVTGVAALAVTGCSAGGTRSASSGTAAKAPGAVEANPGAAEPANKGGAAYDAKGGTTTQFTTGNRSIVYTGTMTVRVDDVDTAAASITQRVVAAGGFVGADRRNDDGDHPRAELTLRVPSGRYDDIVNQIARLGEQVSRDLSTEDVTKQMTDLDARILAGKASVERVRALLARAQNLSEITSIEAELAKREADLESLQAQKRNLDDLVALSTITVTLSSRDAAVAGPARETGFLAGLKAGWKACKAVTRGLLTVLGAVLPFLGLLALIGVPLWWLLRRRRPRPSAGDAPVTTGQPAP